MIITGFESREKELMSENSDLRDSLRHIQGKMGQLFSEPNSPVHSLPSPGHQVRLKYQIIIVSLPSSGHQLPFAADFLRIKIKMLLFFEGHIS